MKVILKLNNGEEISMSQVNSISIMEESNSTLDGEETSEKPIENKWFEVNPKTIDRKLFEEKRENLSQEKTRHIIEKAFLKIDNFPEYSGSFKTTFTDKYWKYKSVSDVVEIARKLDGRIACWFEQALEWAQRIQNGESWEDVCNHPDNANWYRLVAWFDMPGDQNDCFVSIEGASKIGKKYPSSHIRYERYYSYEIVDDAVPLIVHRSE